ncbi:nitrilase-related carbon-nitrogen hydrolase [Corynebacterium uberis]|uniref:nitrilase-related carbon-nitrogen hydrolase n=1 Tax=Corynebacterium TaxID=1716 RepID=UPI001D0BCB8E|nr:MULTISPECIES: nitrilase-related carbon-nitrogen hydrolase [Corynebacterium]MCZ9309668.1 amidohydrolase [Corynebacterium sp. c6VSa_13]UDL73472.1 amidohydrolase [Corynebacterium uberis]UDL75648.1 amidohydrolase [Corynebacterium uberis]UDL77861.1 amidohydrolase [Corynebacterium uberis]UDL80144.1 amidohydrolase [Corynebacterium uberis]
MRIAVAQVKSTDDTRRNAQRVCGEIERAGKRGADLVVFPEAMSQAFATSRLDTRAEELDGPFATAVAAAAREAGLVAVVGMFRPADTVEREGRRVNRVYNTALVTGPGVHEGYDKRHTYDAFGYRESDTVKAGQRAVLVPVGDARVGVATCFDLRFPDLFQGLARAGAQVIAVPASWSGGPGKTRQWRTLVQARALDTGAFVAAADQPGDGEQDDPTGVGHSMIVGPDGAVLAEAGQEEELLVADVSLIDVAQTRRAIPIL